MKKLRSGLCVLLCIALAITFVSCSKNNTNNSSEEASSVSTDESSSAKTSTQSSCTDNVSVDSSGSSSNAIVENTVNDGDTTAITRATAVESEKAEAEKSQFNLPEINVTNKKLRIFVGPEKSLPDFLSVTEIPGPFEVAQSVYGLDYELVSCGDYNDWYTKLSMLVLSDQAPDIAWPLSESYPYDIEKDNILPLDDIIDFSLPMWDGVRSILDEYSWNGKHYHAVVMDGQIMQPLFYNPKIFKANGVETPTECYKEGTWTWDKMRELAVELTMDTNGDGTIDQYGVGGMLFTAMQESTGASMVTVNGTNVTCNIDNPVFATAAQYIYDLSQKGKYKCAVAFSHDNADMFLAGTVAMDAGAHWRAQTTYKDLWAKGTIAVVPFPKMNETSQYYTGGVPSTLVVYKGSQNVDAARAFIYSERYVQTEEFENLYAAKKSELGINDLSNLYADIPGLTDEQAESLRFIWDNDFAANPNTWIGWLDNGWDCGFQYAHEKQWSAIKAIYTNQFNSSISNAIETLNAYTS